MGLDKIYNRGARSRKMIRNLLLSLAAGLGGKATLRTRISEASMLHAWRDPGNEVRVLVDSWVIQESIHNQYIERRRDPGMIWDYLLRIGPIAVWRKIRSRLAEQARNRKVAGVGRGRILDAPPASSFSPGQTVVYFAPNHSPNWKCICLDTRLVRALDAGIVAAADYSRIQLPHALKSYMGWSSYSGRPLDHSILQRELEQLSVHCLRTVSNGAAPKTLIVPRERIDVDVAVDGRPSAVLFGLGNYAKTQILPSIRRHLQLVAIHEIDPDQLVSAISGGVTLDTSPHRRAGESYDAWFIAGFHHTHAPLAAEALRAGAYAVVEKPLVTTRAQYCELEKAATGSSTRRLFACFHKRYSKVNDWIWHDLAVEKGDPVDMHCMVYEIPLPALHWYNWTNSGSRLVSNGCHWLDYFLFVNGFCRVRTSEVRPLRGRDLAVCVTLENDAQMVMSITDTGSERLGIRDVIELRAQDAVVRFTDGTYYDAENSKRILRRRRLNPLAAYRRMYGTICQRIAKGEPGDIEESLLSTVLMLDLEDQLQSR